MSSQIQLWQFLLELLTDTQQTMMRWVGTDGEFEFVQPEAVAVCWGERKGNINMTFATLARALRSYYASGIIAKVMSANQYIYKFMFDMKSLLGYSVPEIIGLIESSRESKTVDNDL